MTIAFPHKPGKGGPGTFQLRMESQLEKSGWKVVYAEDDILPDIVLVVGGTKRLLWLWKMKRLGVPVLYRLDGLSWIHRRVKSSLIVFLKCEIRNLLTQVIRFAFADRLIYQSRFVQNWWEKNGWPVSKEFAVIHNGVDLQTFTIPSFASQKPYVLCLEGTLDYSPYAIRLINNLSKRLYAAGWSLAVYGGFEDSKKKQLLNPSVDYRGVVPRSDLPKVFRNSVYLSLDVNPACPNTVIEALASGAPVVAYNTGALPELVEEGAGRIVEYGSNPWQLGYPDEDNLFDGLLTVLNDWQTFASRARKLAEERFDISNIHNAYACVIESMVSKGRQASSIKAHSR